jgi:hypothetical protein
MSKNPFDNDNYLCMRDAELAKHRLENMCRNLRHIKPGRRFAKKSVDMFLTKKQKRNMKTFEKRKKKEQEQRAAQVAAMSPTEYKLFRKQEAEQLDNELREREIKLQKEMEELAREIESK